MPVVLCTAVKTIGDTILMPNWLDGKPWFSAEAGNDFLKWEKGGRDDYQCSGNQLD